MKRPIQNLREFFAYETSRLRGVARRALRWPPGMTRRQELAFLKDYTANWYQGRGAIVDLGCWMGATSVGLAKGLSGAGSIHCYDTFQWEDWMAPYRDQLHYTFASGDSFLKEFQRNTVQWADRIVVHEGDLRDLGWKDGPIEFLMVDAMKSWGLAETIVLEFYPHLVPGAIIVQQDFCHYYTPWVHLTGFRLRSSFEVVCDISNSGSVVFRSTGSVDVPAVAFSFQEYSTAEIREAFDWARSLVDDPTDVAAAEVMTYIHQQQQDTARQVFDSLVRSGIPVEGDMATVAGLL